MRPRPRADSCLVARHASGVVSLRRRPADDGAVPDLALPCRSRAKLEIARPDTGQPIF